MSRMFNERTGDYMINILITIVISAAFLLTNYIAFGYGLRVGKAMQKDIPETPLVETVKKAYKMVKKSAEVKEAKAALDSYIAPLGPYD